MAQTCSFRIQVIGPIHDVQSLRRLLADWVVPSSEYPGLWELHTYGFDSDTGTHSALLLTDEHAHRGCWFELGLHGSYGELILRGRSPYGPPLRILESLSLRFPLLTFALESHTEGQGYWRSVFCGGQEWDSDYIEFTSLASQEFGWSVKNGEQISREECQESDVTPASLHSCPSPPATLRVWS